MKLKMINIIFTLFLIFMSLTVVANAQGDLAGTCGFNYETLSFRGATLEQATCLLRKVTVGGHFTNQEIPTALKKLMEQPVPITKEALNSYLSKNKIKEIEIGGPLKQSLSRAKSGSSSAPLATYFVIHDTSSNLCKVDKIPRRH